MKGVSRLSTRLIPVGKKNNVTIELLRIAKFFADVFNQTLYHGVQKIKAENLRELDSRELASLEKLKGTLSEEKHRDILKVLERTEFKTDGKVVYAILGIEAQSEIDYAIVVRVLLYDALQYAHQVAERKRENRESKKAMTGAEYLSGFLKEDKLIPVVTAVVYFGEKKWDAAKSMSELFDCDDPELLSHIPHYKLNLIEPQMPVEEIQQLQTQLRELMLILRTPGKTKEERCKIEQILANSRFENLEREVVNVLKEFTNYEFERPEAKGENTMVNLRGVMEDIEARGEARGRAEAKAEVIRSMHTRGFPFDEIARILDMPLEYVQSVSV